VVVAPLPEPVASLPQIIPDGFAGAIITWEDSRSGNYYDIYARRVDASGTPQWALDGVAICTAVNGQSNPQIISDGSGGAIITWEDRRSGSYDIYLRRVDGGGAPLATLAICTALGDQLEPRIIPDGQGKWITSWKDGRSTGADIYAQKFDIYGSMLWTTPDGVAVC
jgi:hypothetical protein